MDQENEINFDFTPYFRVFKSGRLERLLGEEIIPASHDTFTNVTSKDLIINPSTNLSVRLYIPTETIKQANNLPILVYFHGGGFIVETAFSPTYHNYLNDLVSKAKSIAVSVNYRRVPENDLPTVYNDCWEALQWVASHAEGTANPNEPWLSNYGDFSHVFLAGDSAGGNIVHNVVIRSVDEPLRNGVHIKGVALFHPFFWGEKPLENESVNSEVREHIGRLWKYLLPEVGMDDHRVNPLAGGVENLKGFPVDVVLVAVAQKDILKERGKVYCEALKESGWEGEVRFVESEDEEHVFYLKNLESEKTKEVMDAIVALLNKK